MRRDIELSATPVPGMVDTVYFGGGTPSLLETGELERLMQALRAAFRMAPDAEVTLEANPDDIHPEQVTQWTALGINRLSIGIQSFRAEDLRWMNRAHDADQALRCIDIAREAGVKNLSIDLIYGTPGLDDQAWLENLQRATSMGIPHLSCYALTVEPGTALETMIRKKTRTAPASAHQAEQFLITMDALGARGYEHYEISNFALPGMRSRHNSAYWSGAHYVGIGPSAHSYDGANRRWNLSNNAGYIRALQADIIPSEAETLTDTQRLNEYVMTAVRTIEGIDITHVARTWGAEHSTRILQVAQRFIASGKMAVRGNAVVLTREGKLFADGIAADLFV